MGCGQLRIHYTTFTSAMSRGVRPLLSSTSTLALLAISHLTHSVNPLQDINHTFSGKIVEGLEQFFVLLFFYKSLH